MRSDSFFLFWGNRVAKKERERAHSAFCIDWRLFFFLKTEETDADACSLYLYPIPRRPPTHISAATLSTAQRHEPAPTRVQREQSTPHTPRLPCTQLPLRVKPARTHGVRNGTGRHAAHGRKVVDVDDKQAAWWGSLWGGEGS